MNMLRPISRKYDLAEHEYPKELDMLAAMIDGLAESGASEGAGAAGVRRDDRGRRRRGQERHQPGLGHVDPGDVLGRRRPAALDAAAGPRQLRDRVASPTTSSSPGSTASGRAWRSPSPAPAPTRPTSGPPRSSTATSTSSTARRSSSPPATGPTTSWCGRPSTRSSAERRSSRSWSPRARRGCGSSGSSTSSASAPPTPRRSSSRTAGCRRRTCSGRPRSTPNRASPARWRPSTTPARWSPPWPSAAHPRRST